MAKRALIELEPYDVHACTRAMTVYGARRQMLKAVEELSELAAELARALNSDAEPDSEEAASQREKIREETADAVVMLYQVIGLYGEESIRKQLREKMARLNGRLDATFGPHVVCQSADKSSRCASCSHRGLHPPVANCSTEGTVCARTGEFVKCRLPEARTMPTE